MVLPHGTGATLRVAVFAKGEKASEAEAAGADVVGADELAKRIEGGFLDFDIVIATPDMMGVVGRLGKVLGPRSLMPNPKVGTVTVDVKKAVSDAKGGKVEFRAEKAGIVHVKMGKSSFPAEQARSANFNTLVDLVMKLKPATAKGVYLRGIAVSKHDGAGHQARHHRDPRPAPLARSPVGPAADRSGPSVWFRTVFPQKRLVFAKAGIIGPRLLQFGRHVIRRGFFFIPGPRQQGPRRREMTPVGTWATGRGYGGFSSGSNDRKVSPAETWRCGVVPLEGSSRSAALAQASSPPHGWAS